MSPEWMVVVDRMHARARPQGMNRLSDPLEGSEWQGLQWATRLFCRLATMERRPTGTFRSPERGRTAGRLGEGAPMLRGRI